MKKSICFIGSLLLSLPLLAQNPAPPADGGQPPAQGKKWDRGGPGMMHGGERMGTPMGFPFGAWWKNPDVAQRIGLTDAQSQKIDQTFQDFRLKLIDLHANLERQEAMLQPLVDVDSPDDDRVMAQVDKVAQARAALEKANAAMMLAIRHVLSPEQWKKLQDSSPPRRHLEDGSPDRMRQRPPQNPPGGPASND